MCVCKVIVFFLHQVPIGTPEVPSWKAATTTGSREAVRCVNGVRRGARTVALLKEALRGVQIETATRATEEESRPGTPPMTGEEGTVNGIAETTEREVGV